MMEGWDIDLWPMPDKHGINRKVLCIRENVVKGSVGLPVCSYCKKRLNAKKARVSE